MRFPSKEVTDYIVENTEGRQTNLKRRHQLEVNTEKHHTFIEEQTSINYEDHRKVISFTILRDIGQINEYGSFKKVVDAPCTRQVGGFTQPFSLLAS